MRDRRALALVCFLFLAAAQAAFCQSILTYAGGGTTEGMRATAVGLVGPRGLAIDAAGNLYIAEGSGNTVQKVNLSTGVIVRFAGNGGGSFSGDGGPARLASLKGPWGVVFDDAGNLFIADNGNGRIRRVDAATGAITTIAGRTDDGNFTGFGDGGPATAAFLRSPVALAWRNGELYILDDGYDANVVRKIGRDGIITTVAGKAGDAGFSGDGGPATEAKLREPKGLALDAAGNLYIADSGNQRIRKVDAATKNISTIAGGGSPADDLGDGLPATEAKLEYPAALALDPSGALVIGDTYHSRIRRLDPATGRLTTIAGNGDYSGGDGGPATSAGLNAPFAIAYDARGNLFVHDNSNGSIRRIDAQSKIITTAAGGGDYIGDGRVATAAILLRPHGLAFDAKGNLLIADGDHALIRRVDAGTGVISTFAGKLFTVYTDGQDGTDRREAIAGYVIDLAVDKAGNVFAADALNEVIWRIDTNDKIFRYAGGNATDGRNDGDGGPALAASLHPTGIGLDAAGNLFIADSQRHRVRRIDAQTKIITTVAGSGAEGFSGDGGPATQAKLDSPYDVAVDRRGNVFISDTYNGAVRRVDVSSGTISTIAGGTPPRSGNSNGDGGPATAALISPAQLVLDPNNDDLYVTDQNGYRLRRIDAQTQTITTIAGSGNAYFDTDFSGDNGPAKSAKLNFAFDTSGVAIDATGRIFISDTVNDRVRAVSVCASVTAPALAAPANDSTVGTAPTLSWAAVNNAFRYDVLLDTVNPPVRVFAADITDRSVTPANLQPSTRYYWLVIAKGDPFCSSVASARSAVSSFVTTGTCAPAPFDAVAPGAGATVSNSPLQLTWQSAGDGATYDLYLGTVRPPPLVASGLSATSFTTNIAIGTYSWFVVAHAACDRSKTLTTPIRTFVASLQPNCTSGQLHVTASQPADGATGVASTVDLSWTVAGVATSYDVYFGTSPNDLPLLAPALDRTTQSVASLAAGTTYYWRVVAKGPCDGEGVSSAIARFTTRSCAAAGATSIVFAPSTVSEGTTYAIVWSPASGLDADGGYLIERSTSPSFTTILDSQLTSSTAASFLAVSPGTYFHRVRAIPGCDPAKSGPVSEVRSVSVTPARPNVIFSVAPAAVIADLGEHLEDKRGSFTLENIGSAPLQVIVGRQELNSSPPFFTIVDPSATDAAFVTLAPRTPKTFDIRYAGPRTDVAGTYQGVIFVASTGEGLAVTPYAFVNLKVGGSLAAKPQFVVSGSTPTDYAAFPPLTGDDATRAPLTVSIRNNGTAPMELAGEIGPEVWLQTDRTWNATPVAPGATRSLSLFTRRNRAPNGSPLPRYTYFTVRTKDGATARLLVQDSEEIPLASGRTSRLELSARSFIVPEAVSRTNSKGVPLVTQLRLSNLGGAAVQAELIFTPENVDGFDAAAVKRAVVIVPPNDVVTLTDPLVQIFRLAPPLRGAIEVRIPAERVGLLRLTATVVAQGSSGGFVIPVVARGDGAHSGTPHVLGNIVANATTTTALTLTETSGVDGATVRVTLYDSNGTRAGETTLDVPAYGLKHIDNLLTEFNRQVFAAGRVELTVTRGGGAVLGIASIGTADGGATFVSTPLLDNGSTSIVARAFAKRGAGPDATSSGSKVVVSILGPPTSPGSTPAYRTGLTFVAPAGTPSTFFATFLDAAGVTAAPKQTIDVAAGASKVYADVVKDLFGKTSGSGSVFVEPPPGGKVYAMLEPVVSGSSATTPPASLPLLTNLAEALTSAASSSQRPLFFDGLEQSVDSTRGSRWQLVLNEVGGASGLMNVRLYEPGNRTSPIASKDVLIGAFQQLQLDTVFGALGLDAADRRKDRTNVEVVVTALGGTARVAAMAVSIDNATGDTKTFPLAPTVGSGTSSGSKVVAIVPQPLPTPTRRRAAGK
jgi:sugar lactone lactonase YvrE